MNCSCSVQSLHWFAQRIPAASTRASTLTDINQAISYHCRMPEFFLHHLAIAPCIGCGSFMENGTTENCFKGSSEMPQGTFVHKVLRHGRQLLRRKTERSANEPRNVLFLTVNLRYAHVPGTVRNPYLRWLLDRQRSDFLDQGDGGNIWGGSGNGKARTGEEGAGDENEYPGHPRYYLVWGLSISIAWILLRWLLFHCAISKPATTSIGRYAVGVLWLGLVWCLLTFVVWATELPLQILCRCSPEYVRSRVPLVSEFSGLRLHERMARNIGLVPVFALSWFFVSDLHSYLKQVVSCHDMESCRYRCQSWGQSEEKRSFLCARRSGGRTSRGRRRQEGRTP